MRVFALAAASLFAAASCAPRRATQLVIRIRSDLTPVTDLQRVRVVVQRQGVTTAPIADQTFTLGTAPGQFQLPGEVGIIPRDPADRRVVNVSVTATLADTTSFTRMATVAIAQDRITVLDVFLAARCRDPMVAMCPMGQTCGAAGCEPVMVGPLPDLTDAGGDTGMDGRLDAFDAADGDETSVDAPGDACAAGATLCGARCVNTNADPMNCGACANACAVPTNARATCTSGTCSFVCNTGSGNCDGVVSNGCETVLGTNSNCGACGRVCSAGSTCTGTVCACTAGLVACSGFCTNLQTSSLNCGACGAACPTGTTCVAGRCSCAVVGRTLCAGVCVDTANDAANCGTCGNACPMGATCAMRTCQCPAGQMACAGRCVDVQTDAAHCGACGTACPTGGVCTAGMCSCPAPASTNCSGRCVDIMTDAQHCNGCGMACRTGGVCAAGMCSCPATAPTVCGTTCADLMTNAAHCGMCGNSCPTRGVCMGGMCSCPPTAPTMCGATTCADLMTDAANCGACANACPAGRRCRGGMCTTTNDDCSGATALTLPAAGGQTTVVVNLADSSDSMRTCSPRADVFYTFTLATRTAVYVDTFGSTVDTHVGFVESACTNAATACNDNSCATTQSQTFAVLDPGTHYIVVEGTAGTTDTVRLNVQRLAIAGSTSGAVPAGAFSLSGSTAGAAVVGAGLTCGSTTMSPGRWYHWLTCPASGGGALTANTCSSTTFDTVLGYLTSRGAAVCNDDFCSLQSTVSTTATPGATLHALVVVGFAGASGTFTLQGARPP